MRSGCGVRWVRSPRMLARCFWARRIAIGLMNRFAGPGRVLTDLLHLEGTALAATARAPGPACGGGEQDGQGPTAAPHRCPGSATTGTARPLLDPRFAPDMLCPCKILLGVAMRLRRRHFLHLIAGAVGLFRRNEDNPMLRRMMSGATIVATA